MGDVHIVIDDVDALKQCPECVVKEMAVVKKRRTNSVYAVKQVTCQPSGTSDMVFQIHQQDAAPTVDQYVEWFRWLSTRQHGHILCFYGTGRVAVMRIRSRLRAHLPGDVGVTEARMRAALSGSIDENYVVAQLNLIGFHLMHFSAGETLYCTEDALRSALVVKEADPPTPSVPVDIQICAAAATGAVAGLAGYWTFTKQAVMPKI